jgi:probable HAF family extracellular repeat protein
MEPISYEHISPRRRRRRMTAIASSITAAALVTAAFGHAAASAHGRRPSFGPQQQIELASNDTTEATTPTTAVPMTSTTMATATQMRDRDRTSLRFRTIDDALDPTFNQLLGINDKGRIVGYYGSGADAAHPNHGYRVLPPYDQRGFFGKDFPGSIQTQAVGVNNAAVVVGFYVDGTGADVGFVAHGQHYTPVANPETSKTMPFNQLLGINNHGIAVGFYNDADGASHGYTYDTNMGTFTALAVPVPADSVTATGIADDGDVSGFYVQDKITRGFLLHHGSFRTLSFGAHTNTQALGVNNADQVVGSYVDDTGATHGFLWSPGSKLVTVDDPNGAGGTVVNGLNNREQLVGFFTDAAGNTHGLLASTHTAADGADR